MSDLEIFRCPACRGSLAAAGDTLTCGECGAIYAGREGIPCFAAPDSFYEGKFTAPAEDGIARRRGLARAAKSAFDLVSSTTIRHRFTRQFLRRLEPDALILDAACGGGNELLKPYRTVGVDISLASLKTAVDIYGAVAAADARALPFADSCFDAIFSWDFFGHVPAADKDQVLSEWRRVLKPGGWMLHVVEADSGAPFYRRARRQPALYRKYFIELDGHFGLEAPGAIEARFRRAGFAVVRSRSCFKAGIFPPEEYAKRLGPEYASSSRLFGALAAFGAVCERHRQLDRAASLATGIATGITDPWLPDAWGSTLMLELKG